MTSRNKRIREADRWEKKNMPKDKELTGEEADRAAAARISELEEAIRLGRGGPTDENGVPQVRRVIQQITEENRQRRMKEADAREAGRVAAKVAAMNASHE